MLNNGAEALPSVRVRIPMARLTQALTCWLPVAVGMSQWCVMSTGCRALASPCETPTVPISVACSGSVRSMVRAVRCSCGMMSAHNSLAVAAPGPAVDGEPGVVVLAVVVTWCVSAAISQATLPGIAHSPCLQAVVSVLPPMQRIPLHLLEAVTVAAAVAAAMALYVSAVISRATLPGIVLMRAQGAASVVGLVAALVERVAGERRPPLTTTVARQVELLASSVASLATLPGIAHSREVAVGTTRGPTLAVVRLG